MKKELKEVILAYADVSMADGTIISSHEMKRIVYAFSCVPIYKNYNYQDIVGAITSVKFKKKKLIGEGYLIKKTNIENKVFRCAISIDNRYPSTRKLQCCKLRFVGMLEQKNNAFRDVERMNYIDGRYFQEAKSYEVGKGKIKVK